MRSKAAAGKASKFDRGSRVCHTKEQNTSLNTDMTAS